MPQAQTVSIVLRPLSEVRKVFSEERQEHLRTQGKITAQAIQELQASRKYAPLRRSRIRQA